MLKGSKGDSRPLRGACPKLASYSAFRFPRPNSAYFLVATGFFGLIYRTEQYFGPDRGCCSGRKPARFGKSEQKIPVATKKCVELGFAHGKSEYEVSFALAPRNGELSPSEHKTTDPFNSPLRARNPERSSDSNSPQNWGSVGQNMGSWAIYTQR